MACQNVNNIDQYAAASNDLGHNSLVSRSYQNQSLRTGSALSRGAGIVRGSRSSISLRTPPRGPINFSSSPYHSAFQRVQPRTSPPTLEPERAHNFGLMDFAQFRDSGELSDITVCVEGAEFKLHKFPLYTKSDFFRALARAESEKVVLDQFPGGAETFEMVANYCYNKRIELNPDNVCKTRCAAEFLQMSSPGNLAEFADRVLLDLLTTAKLSHDTGIVVDLLLSCRGLGAIAEQAKIVDRCLAAIIDCWLLSSKWTRRLASDRAITESEAFRRMCKLPLVWIKQLLIAAKEKNVRPGVLANLAQMYVVHKIEKRSKIDESNAEEVKDQDRSAEIQTSEKHPKIDHVDKKQDPEDQEDEKQVEEKEEPQTTDGEQNGESLDDAESIQDDQTESDDDDVSEDVDVGVVMDTLLLQLPEGIPIAETFVPKWTAIMLGLADQLHCQCRGFLLRAAAKLLYRFSPADWEQIPPGLLQEVIREAAKSPLNVDPDTLCSVVDGYLLQLAEKGKLDANTFNQMAGSVPKEQRQCHDTLFKVLEKMLKSDNLQISDSDKEALLDAVDFRRLSEEALQHAYDSKLVPDPFVTRAALALCARLRSELETARDIIRAQEEELDRFGLSGGRAATWLHDVETDFGLVTSSREAEVSPYRSDVSVRPKPIPDPVEPFKYSGSGHDPILEKALGGRYYDDPFDIDSTYPWPKYSARKSCYDDVDYGRSSDALYRRSFEPFRSSYYRSPRW